jgi:hypothetical protein
MRSKTSSPRRWGALCERHGLLKIVRELEVHGFDRGGE